MRSRITILVLAIFCLNCTPEKEQEFPIDKQIEVRFNPNIHTSHVIELFVWPGEYPTRPIVVAAQQYFEPFKDHPAIIFSDSLLQNEIFYFDELTEILLYLEAFPSTNFKHPLSNSPYADRIPIITTWIENLAQFYEDAKVEDFLLKHQDFYQGAKQEVLKNLPPMNFAEQIESYYRKSKLSYTIIPAPEMPTGGAYGQRGIGPYVYTEDGMLIYQVISASLPVEKDSISNEYEVFGFDNKEFILRNSYHEFGHAFVNTILDKPTNTKLLDKYETLFTPELKVVMDKINYDNWFDCMAEHLVRLGEIRLAERSGDLSWAEELRAYHTSELNFVFLPELEQKVKEYEADESYNSFEAYLPELFSALDDFNEEKIRSRISQKSGFQFMNRQK